MCGGGPILGGGPTGICCIGGGCIGCIVGGCICCIYIGLSIGGGPVLKSFALNSVLDGGGTSGYIIGFIEGAAASCVDGLFCRMPGI